MNKICPKCKKEFSKPYNESKKAWDTRHVYCSKQCMLEFKPKINLSCWECGGYFIVQNHRKETAHFCSHECNSQYRNQGKRTADKVIRQSAKYKAWRTLVFERDNYSCVLCGIKNGLGKTIYFHADHIQPFALYPELRFEISNGRTLCVPCHLKTGTYGRGAIYRKKCVGSA